MERRRARRQHRVRVREHEPGRRRRHQGRRGGDRDLSVRLRLFAQAREAAGRADDTFDAASLGELLAAAGSDYGAPFRAVLESARVWVNGEEPEQGDATPLHDNDEVAVVPPVSGG
ncbi:MAG TPA: MoaD/ThiS family protein [Acidimicrobiia bacterium]|nr:MoaD/ThiS family protein [Acidimicrobiia bacterium]